MKTMKEEKSILINCKNSVLINNLYNNKFSYKIYEKAYIEIIQGIKNVEFRLLDDKSNRIKKDDIIVFDVINNEKLSIRVKVIDKIIYDDINKLWSDKEIINNNILNLSKEKIIEIINNISNESKLNDCKIVAIKFEILDK